MSIMKNILINLFLIHCFLFCKGQSQKEASYIAKYQLKSEVNGNIKTERFLLSLGSNCSLFQSLDRLESDSITKYSQVSGNGITAFTPRTSGSSIRILNQYSDSFFLESKTLLKTYFWRVPRLNYNWQISSETTTIAGLKCTLATTMHPTLHQKFYVWFTREIPFSAGPSFLSGLPGLVVKAESENGKISYQLYAFSKAPINSMLSNLTLPPNSVKTTKKQYDAMYEAARKDPNGFLMNSGMLEGKIKFSKDDRE